MGVLVLVIVLISKDCTADILRYLITMILPTLYGRSKKVSVTTGRGTDFIRTPFFADSDADFAGPEWT